MKLGFIGCGVMANAMMGGIIRNGLYKPEDIWGADPFEGSREKTKAANGINVTDSFPDNQASVLRKRYRKLQGQHQGRSAVHQHRCRKNS